MFSHSGKPCVVCGSQLVLFVANIECARGSANEDVQLYFCMECESCQCPHVSPLPNGGGSLGWHKKVAERNENWSDDLLRLILPHIGEGVLVDIGCGSGSLLYVANRYGRKGIGYDSDLSAIKYGRVRYGVSLECEYWTPEKTADLNVALITCVSLLEHLVEPLALIEQLSRAAKMHSAKVFVSVPFFNRSKWGSLAKLRIPGPPLNVHVTHFSTKGLIGAFRRNGAISFEEVSAGGWIGCLIGF